MITVKVYADEVLFRLDQIPKRLRATLQSKFETIFATVRQQAFEGSPWKYLNPAIIQSGVVEQGSLVIGYIEANDRDGKYPIVPKAAPYLKFVAEDGGFVKTKLVMHPYLKGAPHIEQLLLESKPWIEDQLEDALIEAL